MKSALAANLEELARGNPAKLLLRYSWPALVAMTLNALYCVVDRVFIGQGCGVDAMAGLQLAMPVMMFFGACGVFIGAGHATILSIKLGAGDRVACERLLGELVAFKLAVFLGLSAFVYFNIDLILSWCGADRVTPAAFAAARGYLKIVLFSHLFSHLAFGLSAMQRAEGGAKSSMMSMVVGFGLNLALDPLLIFGCRFQLSGSRFSLPGLGVTGAAVATDIAMVASCLWALQYYLRRKTVVRLRLRRIGFYRDLAGRAAAVGVAPFLQQLMSSVIMASLSFAFARWMPDAASRTAEIASIGVFSGALVFVFMPILGAQQGLQPIIGYNWGARRYDRVRETLVTGLKVTAALTLVAFVVQVVPPFPRLLARLFVSGEDPALVALCAHDLALSNSMIWCIFVNVVATTYYQSIGRPGVSILLSVLRQGVTLLPIIWFLPYVMADKATAIWLSMPVSDVVCNAVSVLPLALQLRFLAKVRSRR